MKILVVEDDLIVAQSLQLLLGRYNYAVDIAADGEVALQMADAFEYHLVLLDVLLPRLDGLGVCRQLRQKGFRQPILLLTGQGETRQKTIALNAGADDYVVKPFDNDELVARIQALLRRGATASEPILTWDHLSLDPNTRRVAYRDQLLVLAPKEYAILELFLRHPETVFSARAILDQAWRAVESPGEEAVRWHIKDLRKKLTAVGAPKDLIKTIYRVGYRLNPLYSSFSVDPSENCLNLAQIAELKAVNEELRLTLEELQVAEEELKQQNEQLIDAQQLLELEQQRYHDLFEFAPDAYLVTDLQGVIQAANHTASDLFQVKSQALVGKPLTAFVAKAELHDFRLRLNTLNFVQNWEVQVKPREGNSFPVLITVTTIKDLHKEVTGLRWLLRDIQLRKQMEQQLQAAHDELEKRVVERTAELNWREAFLSSIYDGAAQSIFVVDVTETNDFRYISFNCSAQQSTGLSLQDVQNKTPEDVFGLEIGSLFRQNYERCLQANHSITYEDHFFFHDRPIWTLTTLSALRNPQGRIDRIVGTALDISDRKLAEAAIAANLRDTELLHHLSVRLTTETDIQVLYDEILATAIALMHADAGTVQLLDPTSQELVLLSSEGFDQSMTEHFHRVSTSCCTPCGITLSRGERTLVDFDVPEGEDPDGIYRMHVNAGYLSAQSTPLITRSGKFIGVVSTHWRQHHQPGDRELRFLDLLARQAADLIDHRQAEAALHDNELLLHLTMAGAQAGTWDWVLATEQLTWSPETYRLYGLNPTTLLDYDDWYNSLYPDDRSLVKDSVNQVLAQCQSDFQLEFRILHPQHGIRWILSLGHLTVNEQGDPIRLSGINLDISDRRQAEAKLRESEQKYRSLFVSIDQGFCLLEVLFDANDKAIDYRFMEINEAFEQQSGLTNAVGKTILELVPNLEPQWAEFYGQVAKSGEPVRFEADVPSMNRVFDIYAFPSGTTSQHLVAVLFADITQRKRAEEILRRTAELDAFRVSLADALRPLTDASEMQAIAARIVGEFLRATRVVYIEVVSGGEEVIVHRNYTNGVAELSGQYRLADYHRNLIADHQAGHTQVVTDIPDHPRYTDAEKARYRELDIAAHIDVPLLKNDQFVALLAVHQSTPRQWTEIEVKLVEETAERTWAAVERARAEAALHQNEEMLRLALEGARAGTWAWDLATDYLTWSPETYQLYGLDLTASPPSYDDWYENSLHPDDRPWVNTYVNQMITQRQPDLQLEFRILHPQHGIRWILSLGHLTVNEQGEPVRLSGINLDISDRKQAELALQKQVQQEYLLNNIAQEIRRSLQLSDVLSSTVHRVRAFLEVDRVIVLRFRPDGQGDVIMESVGAGWAPILSTTIFDPCFRDHYLEPFRQGRVAMISDIDAAELKPCHLELLQQFQVKANLVVPILQNDHLWGLLIAHQCATSRQWQSAEITALQRLATQVGIAIQQSELYQQLQLELNDRQQAEQKIREQAALLDIATDAILVCDLNCRILYWNQGAEHLYGWQAEEALGQKANELLSRSPSTFLEMKQTVLEQGEWHGEIHRVTKMGRPVIVEGRCTLVRNEAGQPKSILSVDTDITEKKSLEAQFYQAQRLESLGTLTSGIAHDLNNALTPILSIAQLLRMQQSGMNVRSQEMLQLLEDSAKRAADMVQQILAFTRGTGGERTPVDIASLLQEVVKVAQQTFPKFIKIRGILPMLGVRQVSADATQLHQVLMNLCVNARDAMPQGGILTLSVENFEANEIFAQMNLDAQVGQYVLITVTDTGTGIAQEVRDRIFDPFFTTKAFGHGTGLGLSTVLGIVRSYGGFIQVASEVGKGTQFKVYLPAIEMEAVSNLQETPLPSGQGELILVVDDEDHILQSTRVILETHLYQVLTARSGVEATATYAQHQQDIAVVLVDMMMPDMDGVAVIRVLQEINPQVRAIAVSGLLPQYQNRLEALGIRIRLNKPYTTKDLLNSIHLQLLPEA